MGELFPAFEDAFAVSDIAPLEDFDLDVSDSPLVHGGLGGFVEVDGVRSRESPAVVVDDEMFTGIGDSEGGSGWPAGPVRSGAMHFWTKLQVGAEGIFSSVHDMV